MMFNADFGHRKDTFVSFASKKAERRREEERRAAEAAAEVPFFDPKDFGMT